MAVPSDSVVRTGGLGAGGSATGVFSGRAGCSCCSLCDAEDCAAVELGEPAAAKPTSGGGSTARAVDSGGEPDAQPRTRSPTSASGDAASASPKFTEEPHSGALVPVAVPLLHPVSVVRRCIPARSYTRPRACLRCPKTWVVRGVRAMLGGPPWRHDPRVRPRVRPYVQQPKRPWRRPRARLCSHSQCGSPLGRRPTQQRPLGQRSPRNPIAIAAPGSPRAGQSGHVGAYPSTAAATARARETTVGHGCPRTGFAALPTGRAIPGRAIRGTCAEGQRLRLWPRGWSWGAKSSSVQTRVSQPERDTTAHKRPHNSKTSSMPTP